MFKNSNENNDKLVPTLTIGFILLFLLYALVDLSTFTATIQTLFMSASTMFGLWWQWLMIITFVLAALPGLYLIKVGGWPVVFIGAASILAALAYSGGPYPLASNALGDLFVFIFLD